MSASWERHDRTRHRHHAAATASQRAKLKQNEHKGGWRDDDLALLLFRLYEEADELKAEVLRLMELHRQGAKALQPKQTLAVMHEAADVANFAGFIIDKLWASQPIQQPAPGNGDNDQ